MKLAISNLAWNLHDDSAVAQILNSLGVQGVEIAPTKIWPEPLKATPDDWRVYRRTWESRGLRIIAMQALLFGRPDLTIFADSATRTATAEYLERIIEIAEYLGATRLVFGSPRNRSRRNLGVDEAHQIACDFFGRLGRFARQHGAIFCIEPNPVDYQCDYVTNATAGWQLVRDVAEPGFGLHLDAGGMTLSGDGPEFCAQHAAIVRHFHISEPHLAPVGTGTTLHRAFGDALRTGGYDDWISIEMKPPAGVDPLAGIRDALQHAIASYAPQTHVPTPHRQDVKLNKPALI